MNNELEVFRKKLNLKTAITEMKKMPQVECPVKHYFADGQYVREAFMPKGTLVIGKKHKTECINILLKGSIRVLLGEGGEVKDLTAPCVFTTEAGVQKAGYIMEDVIWLNCIPTKHTDLAKIEKDVIMGDDEVLLFSGEEYNGEEHF